METQAIARLNATAGAAFLAKKKKLTSALKKALLNVKRTTQASGKLVKLQGATKAYYGKLYKLYQRAVKTEDPKDLREIISAVKEARAARRAHVKTARKGK